MRTRDAPSRAAVASGRDSVDDPTEGAALRRAWTGAKAAFVGFYWVRSNRHVMAWTAAAMVIYVTLWGLALSAAAAWDERVVAAILWTPGTQWWQSALHVVAGVLLRIIFWLAALGFTFVLAMPVVSPVFAFVAEATERAWFEQPLTHREGLRDLALESARSVFRSLLLVALNVAGAAAIWVCGVVVGVVAAPLGTALSVVIGGGWAAVWLAMAAMSYVLENNRASLRQQLRLLREQPALLLGFGLVSQLLAWVPLTAPVVVVSSTVLACRLHAHGHYELPLRVAAAASGASSGASDDAA